MSTRVSEFLSDTQSRNPLEIIPIALLGDQYHDEMVEDTADPVVPYRLRRNTGASFIIWTDSGTSTRRNAGIKGAFKQTTPKSHRIY